MLIYVLFVLALLAFLGAFPTGGYGFTAWGTYGAQSVLGTVLIIILIIWLVQYV